MEYKKRFDPAPTMTFPANEGPGRVTKGDRRDGLIYVYTEEIVLAVNVALVTGRPLLIRGSSGSGKSSLALNVAKCMGWRYFEEVVSSRTEATDLQWHFDAVRRLSDAQANAHMRSLTAYIRPGVLWWAFDAKGARTQGLSVDDTGTFDWGRYSSDMDATRAVVLLDEIDKADPDVPNNLLVPLGSHEFQVAETGEIVRVAHADPPLVLITSNDERDLPPAFLRRCVTLVLPDPTAGSLVQVAAAHFGDGGTDLYAIVAKHVTTAAPAQDGRSTGMSASAAEYLDLVRACIDLGVTPEPGDRVWEQVLKATVVKPKEGARPA